MASCGLLEVTDRRPRTLPFFRSRLVGAWPMLSQLGAQLPGPGLVHSSSFQQPSPQAQAAKRQRLPSTGEETGLVEDLPGPQQVIDGAAQLGREDAKCFARTVLVRHA